MCFGSNLGRDTGYPDRILVVFYGLSLVCVKQFGTVLVYHAFRDFILTKGTLVYLNNHDHALPDLNVNIYDSLSFFHLIWRYIISAVVK
jgi:hypothetical protein